MKDLKQKANNAIERIFSAALPLQKPLTLNVSHGKEKHEVSAVSVINDTTCFMLFR